MQEKGRGENGGRRDRRRGEGKRGKGERMSHKTAEAWIEWWVIK